MASDTCVTTGTTPRLTTWALSSTMILMNFLIYMHTSPSGKSYIGQTNNLHKRNLGHQRKTGCRALKSAIDKYGWENFTHEILAEGLTIDEANRLEKALIRERNTITPNGYNLRDGGDSGGLHSAETRKRLSESKLGTKHSPETRAKISVISRNRSAETREKQRLSHIGTRRDDATRARMSEAMKGLKRSPEGCANIKAAKQNMPQATRDKLSMANLGKTASAETRKKLSIAHTGYKHSEEAKAKMSAALKGRVVSDETRRKLSESTKGRVGHNKGIPLTDAQKEKMSQALRNPSQERRDRLSEASKAAWGRRKERGEARQSPETVAKRVASSMATKELNKKKAAQGGLVSLQV